MPEEVGALVFVAPALPGNSSGGSFARRIGLGKQLQLLYNRAIMGSEGPGLQVCGLMLSLCWRGRCCQRMVPELSTEALPAHAACAPAACVRAWHACLLGPHWWEVCGERRAHWQALSLHDGCSPPRTAMCGQGVQLCVGVTCQECKAVRGCWGQVVTWLVCST